MKLLRLAARLGAQRLLSSSTDSSAKLAVLKMEHGATGDPLPLWHCAKPNNIPTLPGPNPDGCVELVDLSDCVPGCFQLLNVLSADECQNVDLLGDTSSGHADGERRGLGTRRVASESSRSGAS